MKVFFVFLVLSVLLSLAATQDSREAEESNIPKKVLRKYRIRRPVIVDENGNALTPRAGPRLRRVRVKQQPKPSDTVVEARPEALLDARYGNVQQQAKPQALAQQQGQQQQVYYSEQQVVEPVRVVPQYRTATSSSTRSALLANVNLKTNYDGRGGDDEKKPVVGTTRNYSHINEDGSFTFGYEGEDGSFKEETRGTDCVVRGKYGYVDPDGVRREFSYVSGNPCDPNDPDKDNDPAEDEDELGAPPARAGLRQRVPLQRRPVQVITDVQQSLEQTNEERLSADQLPALFRVNPRQRARPTAQPLRSDPDQPTTFRPRIRITQAAPTTPAPEPQQLLARAFPQFRQPRPILQDPEARGPFNFDQELQSLQQQEPDAAPQFQYQRQQHQPQALFQQQQQPQQVQYQQQPAQVQYQQHQPRAFSQQIFGGANAAALLNQHFPQQQQRQQQQPQQQQTNYGNYRTELVYNPASGQYTSVLVQDAPKSGEEFTLTQRLRAFADPRTPQQYQQQRFGPVQYYQPQQQQQQHERQPLFERQQSFQPSASTISRLHADAQEAMNSPATGQIDAFLRTLNLSA